MTEKVDDADVSERIIREIEGGPAQVSVPEEYEPDGSEEPFDGSLEPASFKFLGDSVDSSEGSDVTIGIPKGSPDGRESAEFRLIRPSSSTKEF